MTVTQISKEDNPPTHLVFPVENLYVCGDLIGTTSILELDRPCEEIRQMPEASNGSHQRSAAFQHLSSPGKSSSPRLLKPRGPPEMLPLGFGPPGEQPSACLRAFGSSLLAGDPVSRALPARGRGDRTSAENKHHHPVTPKRSRATSSYVLKTPEED